MAKFGMSLGAASPAPPPQIKAGSSPVIDWTLPQYATPRPAPKRVFGRHTAQHTTTPQLPERTIRVRGKAPATAYTKDGTPIPTDQWVTVPISPGLIEAEKRGDVEFDKGESDAEQSHSRRHRPPPPASE